MFELLIDTSDKRLPNGNVKGKGFVLKRDFAEAYRAARKAEEKELSHVAILSSSYKRTKKKFEKNKYISAFSGLMVIAMHYQDMMGIRPIDHDYLQRCAMNATFHKDYDDVVVELMLKHNLKLLPFKKLFYGKKSEGRRGNE